MPDGNALIAALRGASGYADAPQSDAPMFQTYNAPWQVSGMMQLPSFVAPMPKQATGPSISALRDQRMTAAADKSAQIQALRNQQMNGPFPEYYNRDTDSWEQNTDAYFGPNTLAQPWYPADMKEVDPETVPHGQLVYDWSNWNPPPEPAYVSEYNRDTDSWEPNYNIYQPPGSSLEGEQAPQKQQNTVQPWYPPDMPTETTPDVALPPPMRTDTPTWGEYDGQWMWAFPDEMAAMSQPEQPAAPEAPQQYIAPEAPSYQEPQPQYFEPEVPSYQPPVQEQPQYQEVYDRDADAWVPSYQDAPQQQYIAPEAPSYQEPQPQYFEPQVPSYQAPVQEVQQQPQEYTEGPIWGYNEREGMWMWYDPNDTSPVYR